MSEQARFFSKVDSSGGPWSCWPWQAKLNAAGYGQFWPSHGVGVYAHRWAYADSHRYRQCGNGVAAPVTEWVGRQIMAVGR